MLNKRTAEFASVVLCIAMLLGIAIPTYQKIVQRAGSVTAAYNLDAARKNIDQALLDPLMGTGATYGEMTAKNLLKLAPGVLWKDFPPDSQLPPYDKLSSIQKSTVYLLPANNGNELYLMTITADRKIVYCRAVDGTWDNYVKVPYEQGVPGLVTVAQ